MQDFTRELLDYIDKSPTAFHAVANLAEMLEGQGFIQLKECETWNLQAGKGYYVVRNDSSIISFIMPVDRPEAFRIIASHSDSPAFKVKENPELSDKDYIRLNIEGYGGMINYSWFDRPLSVAGRLVTYEEGKIESRLFNIDKDLLMIPSLAIHMDRNVNKGKEINIQKDMPPILMEAGEEACLKGVIEAETGIPAHAIVSGDIFLYNRMKSSVWGPKGEFISAGRIDNLECCYATYKGFEAFANCENPGGIIRVHAAFDNEEVGSGSRQGADSTLLADILERISLALGYGREEYMALLAGSFMLSADNAHAAHPNYPEKVDPVNRPVMNKGIVIKYNANQKYTTDGVSGAEVMKLCASKEIPYQIFTNRSDMPGGSTLGNISQAHVSVKTADIGLAQLAMHSAYETAGAEDPEYMKNLSEAFYEG